MIFHFYHSTLKNNSFDTIEKDALSRDCLDTDSVMVIDSIKIIYLWIGKNVGKEYLNKATLIGNAYLKSIKKNLPVRSFNEGHENSEFNDIFDL